MTMPSKPAPTSTYAAAYSELSTIAERLRTASGPTSLDGLLKDVRAAKAAFRICRDRLAEIRQEIDVELDAVQTLDEDRAG